MNIQQSGSKGMRHDVPAEWTSDARNTLFRSWGRAYKRKHTRQGRRRGRAVIEAQLLEDERWDKAEREQAEYWDELAYEEELIEFYRRLELPLEWEPLPYEQPDPYNALAGWAGGLTADRWDDGGYE